MDTIRPGDLAVVVQGLWPNVGRVVYVSEHVSDFDFNAMRLGIRDGWRVRNWSDGPLQTIVGPGMVGITPVGSLRRLDRLTTRLQAELDARMALADLADYFAQSEKVLECEAAM